MLFQTAFSFSGVIQRLAGRFSGLRLRAAWEFQAFLASSPYAASVSSYHSSSIVLFLRGAVLFTVLARR